MKALQLCNTPLAAAVGLLTLAVPPGCQMPQDQLSSLWEVLRRHVRESRSVHGQRHKQATVLTIVFAYLVGGEEGGHWAVATFGRDLTPTQRA